MGTLHCSMLCSLISWSISLLHRSSFEDGRALSPHLNISRVCHIVADHQPVLFTWSFLSLENQIAIQEMWPNKNQKMLAGDQYMPFYSGNCWNSKSWVTFPVSPSVSCWNQEQSPAFTPRTSFFYFSLNLPACWIKHRHIRTQTSIFWILDLILLKKKKKKVLTPGKSARKKHVKNSKTLSKKVLKVLRQECKVCGWDTWSPWIP